MSKRYRADEVRIVEVLEDERAMKRRAIARSIANKIAAYHLGYLGMSVSYDKDALFQVLDAIRSDLMREVQHHDRIPKEIKLEVAKGVSALAKSWDFIVKKEEEGAFAWWMAIAAQLIEDQIAAMELIGLRIHKGQGPLSTLTARELPALPDAGSGSPPD